ncbi:acetyl-CoA synthetase [Halobacteriales archaeon SW_5_70_135]|nr:MAG: acetyl-CoA synthetase [Halobacteriales archaeon SW_5_70_135]
MDSLEEVDEVVHEPSGRLATDTNLHQFAREHDLDVDEAVEYTTEHVDWFWDTVVDHLGVEFYEDYDAVRDDSEGPQFTEWYPGAELNVAHNTLDRHARARPDEPAILWEGEPGEVREVSYGELHAQANRVANYLDDAGVERGDTVSLYMPMVPEVAAIVYGCFKVGAIAVPIFSGFGVDATATRIEESASAVMFTGDGFYRRGDEVRLKATADEAIAEAGHVERVVVYDRLGDEPSTEREGTDVPWTDRDEWWADAVGSRSAAFDTRSLPSDAESMLLYSSGTTGRPKGIVHTHAGIQMQCAKEVYFGFDHQPEDRFFWVSDIGWMMGPWTLVGNHTFGGTVFVYEGAPDHPQPDRYWRMIEEHDLTVFGVSPTAVRALRKHGDEPVEDRDLSSLRLLGSTGEPWDPESWKWFHRTVGGGDCPIVNISGGTEICGCFLMPMPHQPLKPCTLGGPGLGMDVDVVDDRGESVREAGERGYLVARDSCPSMTESLWEGDERYLEEYWSTWPDVWDHGDWAQVDEDGFWFLHGRADDALNVAGRKVGPAEVEGALIDHPAVNQAAAVGAPDETTGTAVVAYVVLEPRTEPSEELRETLRRQIGAEMGKPFRPREILFVEEFPKTQSGKIVRRAIAAAYRGEDPGDLSSMENPEALEAIRATS